ncbi:neural cell adhesion molecule L1-like protein isoform X2 [Rhinatrema bivittatum]|nr:neural cell adhesion molecule L1-like protein isoform X2 [Rhinatrema bivittatum]XP_029449327.1 neural cell adhesion molecule L1-like protein isoform X2 [Rhinatrema bivittatum]
MKHFAAEVFFLCVFSIQRLAQAVEIPPQVKQLPTITEWSSATLVAFPLDENFSIKCEAKGNPEPVFHWTKDGEPYDPFVDPRVQTAKYSGTFKIHNNGNISDFQGKYRCYASNSLGTAISEEVQFIVPSVPTFPNEVIEPVVVKEGDPVVLHCNPPTGLPPLHIYWMTQDLVHIPQDDRVSVGLDGNLYFANVEEIDSRSDYCCVAAFTIFRTMVQKMPMTLTVHSDNSVNERRPKLLIPTGRNTSRVILRGEDLVMECIAEALPTPKLEWRKIGGDLPKHRVMTENYGKILKVKNVSEADGGTYRCIASNHIGTAQHEFHINVEEPPQWKKKPESNVYSIGSNTVLLCDATGNPQPEIKWKVNGVPIVNVTLPLNHLDFGREISITNLQLEDSAVYQCEASNTHGTILTSANIDVLHIPPLILSLNNVEYLTVARKPVFLHCKVFAVPTPVISWIKEDSTAPLQGANFFIHDNGTLEIKEPDQDDSGSYTCWVTNELKKTAITAHLRVLDATEVGLMPASAYILKSQTVLWNCHVETDPQLRNSLKISWRKDDEEILLMGTEHNRIIIEKNALSILSVMPEDQGNYSCVAHTSLDSASAKAYLTVLDVPNPPENLQLMEKQNQSVRLSWEAGNSHHSPMKAFIVEYEEKRWEPGEWQELARVPPNETAALLPLAPYLQYQFRVLAVNDVGRSQPSEPSELYETPPAAPDRNPGNLRVEVDDPNEMIIKWEPLKPAEHNGPGLAYRVSWRLSGQESKWNEETVRRHSFTVKDTPAYVPYDIQVQAENRFGSAPKPKIFMAYSGEKAPDAAPLNVTVEILNSTLIKVSWSKITEDQARGHLGGYKVNWWKVRSLLDGRKHQSEHHFLTFPGDRDSGMVPGLEPFSEYHLSVAAFNTRGDGPESVRKTFQTPQGVPEQPHFLKILSFDKDSVTLSWGLPSKPNGILTGYLLQYQMINDTDEIGTLNEINVTNPLKVAWRIPGLDHSTRYKFYLYACTALGCGKPVTEEGLTTMQASMGIGRISEAVNSTQRFRPTDSHEPRVQLTVQLVTKSEASNSSIFEDVIETRGRAYVGVHEGVSTQGWFIGLMCAVALLTLILLVVCFVHRNKGGKYSVKEKEDLHPDLEAESMKDENFGDYSDEKPLKSSLQSLSMDMKCSESADSLVDYGDGEHGQFNEDGSFIGAYIGSKGKETIEGNGNSTILYPIHA